MCIGLTLGVCVGALLDAKNHKKVDSGEDGTKNTDGNTVEDDSTTEDVENGDHAD